MNEKQQQLTFDKGITNVPSDALCSDNSLAESVGLTYADGEHRVIQKPKAFSRPQYNLLFVHRLENGQDNFIHDSGSSLYYNNNVISNSFHSGTIGKQHIRAIGKTLIVVLDNKLSYFLYKDGAYYFIGNTIPRPLMIFGLSGEPGSTVSQLTYSSTFKYIRVGNVLGLSGSPDWAIEDSSVYDDSTKGLYAEGKKKASQQKAFALPFFVRYALKLYDGTYTHISNPIPLFPSSTNSCFWNAGVFYIHAMYLVYKNLQTYGDWTDIVKGISIFATNGIELYDLTLPSTIAEMGENREHEVTRFSIDGPSGDGGMIDFNFPFEYKSKTELSDELTSESVFYHLCDISATKSATTFTQLKDNFSHITLENLTTQEQLPYDNYYSLAPLTAGYLYDYNNRLNLAHVKRGFFDGYTAFSGIYLTHEWTYSIFVRIASESGPRVVGAVLFDTYEAIGAYFFYPDPRANHVTIYQGTKCILDEDLIEHPGLNGAYYFFGWPDPLLPQPTTETSPTLDGNDIDTTPEELFSYIVTSEVNNPFVFRAEGYNRIGTGNVIGMCTMTTALSQGQFGQYPLIVFTTQGIWAMSVNNTGLFSSIQPMSREVANESNPAITEVDGAVFFASSKGLMLIQGSQVSCVSKQLSGRDGSRSGVPFVEYLKDAFIAYDYRDSLLWIFNIEYGFEEYCYIYNISSGTFSEMLLENAIENVVNYYPDYLLQDGNHVVYTLTGRSDINLDGSTYNGVFTPNTYRASLLTRPMKQENALALKSIMQIRHIHDMNEDATLTLRIFASNNLKNWVELHSLRGTPWKYYRFRYDFSNLIATDRFAGTMLITQERRTNKLR